MIRENDRADKRDKACALYAIRMSRKQRNGTERIKERGGDGNPFLQCENSFVRGEWEDHRRRTLDGKGSDLLYRRGGTGCAGGLYKGNRFKRKSASSRL